MKRLPQTILMAPARRVRELIRVHPTLREVIADVVDRWPTDYCRIVDIHRSMDENRRAGATSSIHVVGPPWRAVDFGARDLGQTAEEAWGAVADIAEAINAIWLYDPARRSKMVAISGQHGTGPHLHCQVHPNTTRRPATRPLRLA